MARSSTSAGALIEILSLCEQALKSLHSDNESVSSARQPDKTSLAQPGKRSNVGRRLVLIRGGLSIVNRGGTSR
jgi:hypothetical protein